MENSWTNLCIEIPPFRSAWMCCQIATIFQEIMLIAFYVKIIQLVCLDIKNPFHCTLKYFKIYSQGLTGREKLSLINTSIQIGQEGQSEVDRIYTLFLAARLGNVEAFIFLLDHGAELDLQVCYSNPFTIISSLLNSVWCFGTHSNRIISTESNIIQEMTKSENYGACIFTKILDHTYV